MATATLKQITISKSEQVPAVIISLAQYEKMREDLDMFYSKTFVQDIKKSRSEVKDGQTISWSDAKKKLKLQ